MHQIAQSAVTASIGTAIASLFLAAFLEFAERTLYLPIRAAVFF
jgi:hypothetical protein